MAKTAEKQKATIRGTRPPVVVVMGHVDHGKTTLLDFIRKSHVAEREAGGITQHIGAYTIDSPRTITFVDTPGHEAFSQMRSRGAKVADIGILVVAADEGVKPQTREAIQILKGAKIPFIVAINKIDRPGSDIDRVKKELSENDVQVESWGGKIPSVEISAKTGEHVSELLDLILLLADIENFSGDASLPAEGVVIESHRDPRRGATGTILVRSGTLRRGDFVVIDGAVSSIKILEDFQGKTVDSAGLSEPVRIAGLVEVPGVGSSVKTFNNKKEAEEFSVSEKSGRTKQEQKNEEGKTYINVILKADVSGSREAIEGVLETMQLPDIGIRLIRSEVGDISDSDLQLALSSSNVLIIGFKVKFPPHLLEQAKNNNIPVIQGDIIYTIFDEFKAAIAHLIPAEIRETLTGKLKVLKFFKQEKSKQVVGGKVIEGIIQPGTFFRLLRKNSPVGKGKIFGLQERKSAVKEATEGNECGLLVEADIQVAENDVLEVYKEERIERSF